MNFSKLFCICYLQKHYIILFAICSYTTNIFCSFLRREQILLEAPVSESLVSYHTSRPGVAGGKVNDLVVFRSQDGLFLIAVLQNISIHHLHLETPVCYAISPQTPAQQIRNSHNHTSIPRWKCDTVENVIKEATQP